MHIKIIFRKPFSFICKYHIKYIVNFSYKTNTFLSFKKTICSSSIFQNPIKHTIISENSIRMPFTFSTCLYQKHILYNNGTYDPVIFVTVKYMYYLIIYLFSISYTLCLYPLPYTLPLIMHFYAHIYI